MALQTLRGILGPEIEDPEEETFLLFSQDIPSQNLGFVDSAAAVLELTVAGRDLTIHQSPRVLSSNRAGGTTGAVVWKVTPLFAEWLASRNNILFSTGILSGSSAVLELGCGVSAIVGLTLAPHVSRYVLSDQPYVAKFVAQNLEENRSMSSAAAAAAAGARSPPPPPLGARSKAPARGHRAKLAGAADRSPSAASKAAGNLLFVPLDWEQDEVTASLTGSAETLDFDAVVACDCIYNEALIEPFVRTCVDVCRLRSSSSSSGNASSSTGTPDDLQRSPCVCVVAQQLRDSDVFEAWATRFSQSFHVLRVPDEQLPAGLRSAAGFVVHIGLLRN